MNPLPSYDRRPLLPVPLVKQFPAMCGPACLRSVLLYWGLDVAQERLAALSGWTKQLGAPAEGLAAAVKALGFQGRVLSNCTLEDLVGWYSKKVPVIVEWYSVNEGHYSVLTGFDDKGICLMDPFKGEYKSLDTDIFLRIWFDFRDTTNIIGLVRRQMIVILPA